MNLDITDHVLTEGDGYQLVLNEMKILNKKKSGVSKYRNKYNIRAAK